ncbi:hypothetical protein [Streptomyces tsukubensis]|uniref:hypothetical protein n=1 Tax=Streptomyces tsukubensis TaxID=83656 RepID=UPI00117C7D4C|nr:hypothetical protein [Streptomyces tsukubensis]QFR93738.1 hypothetical protein GBW32_12465 [Streptomyces tsukubensis]
MVILTGENQKTDKGAERITIRQKSAPVTTAPAVLAAAAAANTRSHTYEPSQRAPYHDDHGCGLRASAATKDIARPHPPGVGPVDGQVNI